MNLYFYSQPTIHTADCKVIPLACENDQAFYTDSHGKKVIAGAMTCSTGGSIDQAALVAAIRADLEREGGMLDSIDCGSVVLCGGFSADIENSELSGDLTCRV